jgi:hypothetical protein
LPYGPLRSAAVTNVPFLRRDELLHLPEIIIAATIGSRAVRDGATPSGDSGAIAESRELMANPDAVIAGRQCLRDGRKLTQMWEERLLTLAREARERAEEVLTRAETFQDAYAKQKMREIAAEYENLAQRLEQAAAEK